MRRGDYFIQAVFDQHSLYAHKTEQCLRSPHDSVRRRVRPTILESTEPGLKSFDIISQCFGLLTEGISFISTGQCAAFLLKVFAHVLPNRLVGILAPATDIPGNVAKAVRDYIAEYAG